MYKKFKDCLFAPRNIADYVDEPKRKTVLYVLILLFVYILPMLVIAIFSNTIAPSISDKFVEDFSQHEIHYVIENGVLVKTDETASVELVESVVTAAEYEVPVLFVFDTSTEDISKTLVLPGGNYLLFVFNTNNFRIINYSMPKEDAPGDVENGNGAELLAEESANTFVLFDETYEELKIENINFTNSIKNNDYTFKSEIASFANNVYKNIKNKLLWIIIIVIIFAGVSSYFMSILFIAFLEKLIYGYLKLPFGKIFKTTILCSTPYVICCIVSSVTGWSFLEIVGDLIMIFYTVKAMTNYKFKYAGGIPMPNYMNQNINEDIDEKGNDDNEL